MLTGLIGNALGYDHSDFAKLTDLQERLDFAARWDVDPEVMVDYHTVDLGSPKMRNPGWTTSGSLSTGRVALLPAMASTRGTGITWWMA